MFHRCLSTEWKHQSKVVNFAKFLQGMVPSPSDLLRFLAKQVDSSELVRMLNKAEPNTFCLWEESATL